MEDKIDKLYDLMEKMYVDLKGDIKKLQITQEQMETKLDSMAEVQQGHYVENKREHKEMLIRLDRVEAAILENQADIYNLKKVK